MDDNLYYFLYIVLSGVYLSIIFLVSLLLEHITKTPKDLGRKIIHILFANWYFIPFLMVSAREQTLIAIIPPLIFTALNFLSYRYKIVKMIERDNRFDLGTISYPLAFTLIIILANYFFKMPYIGLLAALILGYGDGLASIVGRYFSGDKNHKSIYGFITMLTVSFILALVFVVLYQGFAYFYFAIVIALLSAVLEYFGPHGIDNITVPLGVSLGYFLLVFLII